MVGGHDPCRYTSHSLKNMLSAIQISLLEKIRSVTSLLPTSHLNSSTPRLRLRKYSTQAQAKTRFQNWAFTQGPAIVIEKSDV